MSPVAQAVLASWSFPTLATALNLFVAVLYIRGWILLRRGAHQRSTAERLGSFLAGLVILELALASPIDAFDPFFLTDHMLQHVLLMMVVPPLLLLGEPEIPLRRGLPHSISRRVLGPLSSSPSIRWIGGRLIDPAVAWLLMAIAMIGWHLPSAYELALRSPGWHEVEHICFLGAATLFWWPVIEPWPSRRVWPRWRMPIYLLLADFVNSALSAFLVFSDRVLYRSYQAVPRLWGISALNDQVAAGAMMWVVGSFAFLIPAAAITFKLLSPVERSSERPRRPELGAPQLPVARSALGALAVLAPIAALGYGWFAPGATDIDDAALRLEQRSGPFRVSLFAPADPIDPGPCDVSVLVQDADSEEPLLDADVHLAVESPGGQRALVHLTHQQSANKLLASATALLPHSGRWDLRVLVRRAGAEAAVSETLQVSAPTSDQASEPRRMAGAPAR
jgi:putative membrane protein